MSNYARAPGPFIKLALIVGAISVLGQIAQAGEIGQRSPSDKLEKRASPEAASQYPWAVAEEEDQEGDVIAPNATGALALATVLITSPDVLQTSSVTLTPYTQTNTNGGSGTGTGGTGHITGGPGETPADVEKAPEPDSVLLASVGMGLALVGGLRRRRRQLAVA